jgi:hypothetical protein
MSSYRLAFWVENFHFSPGDQRGSVLRLLGGEPSRSQLSAMELYYVV